MGSSMAKTTLNALPSVCTTLRSISNTLLRIPLTSTASVMLLTISLLSVPFEQKRSRKVYNKYILVAYFGVLRKSCN